MNQKKILSVVITGIAIAAITIGIIYFGNGLTVDEVIVDEQYTTYDEKGIPRTVGWVYSGPFGIDKKSYLIGNNIFVTVHGLEPYEKGRILFVRPDNIIYRILTFDGSDKSDFNHYFTPYLTVESSTCTVDDIIGNWTISFEGTQYEPITFEIRNEYLSEGEEQRFSTPLC